MENAEQAGSRSAHEALKAKRTHGGLEPDTGSRSKWRNAGYRRSRRSANAQAARNEAAERKDAGATGATVRNLSAFLKPVRKIVSSSFAVTSMHTGYRDMNASDIVDIDERPLTQRLVIRPMEGSQAPDFTLRVVTKMFTILSEEWENDFVIDDGRFHEVLRYFAAMHYFIGGNSYSKSLADTLGISISTVNRWLSGHTAPTPTTRLVTFKESDEAIRRLAKERAHGTAVQDYDAGI